MEYKTLIPKVSVIRRSHYLEGKSLTRAGVIRILVNYLVIKNRGRESKMDGSDMRTTIQQVDKGKYRDGGYKRTS